MHTDTGTFPGGCLEECWEVETHMTSLPNHATWSNVLNGFTCFWRAESAHEFNMHITTCKKSSQKLFQCDSREFLVCFQEKTFPMRTFVLSHPQPPYKVRSVCFSSVFVIGPLKQNCKCQQSHAVYIGSDRFRDAGNGIRISSA